MENMRYNKNVLLTMLLVMICAVGFSKTVKSYKNGNWNDKNTWKTGPFDFFPAIPDPGDIVKIAHVVTLTDDRTCGEIIILEQECDFIDALGICIGVRTDGVLKLGGNTLTVNGSFTNYYSFDAGTGTVKFTGTGTIGGNKSISFFNLLINNPSYTVTLGRDIAVTNNLTITAGTFNTSTFGMSGIGNFTATGGTLQLAKLSTTLPELTGTYSLTGGLVEFNGAGSQTIRNTTYYDVTLSASGTKTSAGILDINRNLLISSGTTLNANNYNMSIAGNWTNNGGTFTPGTNTVTFDGGAAQTIGGSSASQTFYNIVVGLTAGQTLNTGATPTTLTVQNYTQNTGNFTGPATLNINGTFTLNDGTYTAGANQYVTGNCAIYGGSYVVGTGTITFNGTGVSQTVYTPGTAITLYNVTLNLSSGTVFDLVAPNVEFNTQNFTQISGNFTAPATFTINGDATLSGGTLTAGANIYAKGNWTNNGGTFTPGTNTVTFNGGSSQSIVGGTGITAQTFYNVVAAITTAGQILTTGGSTVTLTVNNLTQSVCNVTAPATLNINGNYTLNSGTFTAGANIYAKGNWTNNGGTFTPGTNTVTFNGGSSQSIVGGTGITAQTFYNVVAGITTGGQILTTGGSTVTLTVNNLTQSICTVTAPATLNINGNYTLTSGTLTAGAAININGNTVLNGGTLTAGLDIYVKGNWTNNGGTFTGGLATPNAVTFNGSSTQTINGTAKSQTFNDINANGTTLNTGGATDTLTIKKLTVNTGNVNAPVKLTMTGKMVLFGGTFTAGANIYTLGYWTNNGGTFVPGTNTVTFIGIAPKFIDGSATSQTFYNVVLNGAGITVGGGTSLITTLTVQNLTQTKGDFAAPATLNINGNYTLTSGTFTSGTAVNVKGNWMSNGGTFDPGSSTTTFNSTTAQTIGGLNNNLFYNLVLNNTFGTSPQMNMATDVTVKNTLTMTNGNTNLWGNTLTLGTSDVSPGAISRSGGWLYNGDFKRYVSVASLSIGDAAGFFPIGSAQDYRPFWISHSDALTTGGTVTVSHSATYPASFTKVNFSDATWGAGTTIKYLSSSYWRLTLSGITGGASTFSIRAEATGIGPVSDVNHLNLCNGAGTVGSYAASGGTTSNPQVNRTGLSFADLSFTNMTTRAPEDFSIGSNSSLSPLPISLLKFEAVLEGQHAVAVSWVTASETNNDYFTVEKSPDGVNFEEVESIDGAGNSTRMLTYNSADYSPFTGQSYYRLKQTDFDGKFTYSNIVPINTGAQSTLTVYPNPAADNDAIKMIVPTNFIDKKVVIEVYDLQGRKAYSSDIFVESGKENLTIIDRKLSTDTYIVSIISGSNVYKQILIVK